MTTFKRLAINLVLGGIVAFCLYGLLCTFEPLNPAVQLRWRIGYGALAALAVAGLVRANSRKST